MNIVLKASAIAMVTVLAAGCSNKEAHRLNAVEMTAQQAQATAMQAQQTAQQALGAAMQAQQTADEANERASRMLVRAVRK